MSRDPYATIIVVDPCDGDECHTTTLGDFLDDNIESFDRTEIHAMMVLPVGGVYEGGGGAGAAWKITRTA